MGSAKVDLVFWRRPHIRHVKLPVQDEESLHQDSPDSRRSHHDKVKDQQTTCHHRSEDHDPTEASKTSHNMSM